MDPADIVVNAAVKGPQTVSESSGIDKNKVVWRAQLSVANTKQESKNVLLRQPERNRTS